MIEPVTGESQRAGLVAVGEGGFRAAQGDELAERQLVRRRVGGRSFTAERLEQFQRFVADLAEDHLSAERMELLENDAVAIAERLLGTSGPRPI